LSKVKLNGRGARWLLVKLHLGVILNIRAFISATRLVV
jgi:hypothetical protein